MKEIDADRISRADLLALKEGSATSLEDAAAITAAREVAIVLDDSAATDPNAHAAALTAVATAIRGFGRVYAVMPAGALLHAGPYRGSHLAEAVRAEGALLVANPSTIPFSVPIIWIGLNALDEASSARRAPVIFAEWSRWTAYATPRSSRRASSGNVLAAIAAGVLAVAEAFTYLRELPGNDAGFRTASLDLWSSPGTPAELLHAPAAWWLIGLGHLGQAFAWVLAHLPYSDLGHVQIVVQDDEKAAIANFSTSILTARGSEGQFKTRLVADGLHRAGLEARIIEQRLRPGAGPAREQLHFVALNGTDSLPARREISAHGWKLAIDMGLGAGAADFTSISMHRFPGKVTSGEVKAWAKPAAPQEVEVDPALEKLAGEYDQCGLITLSGKAIGYPFVGMIAATIGIAEAVKQLNGGISREAATFDLTRQLKNDGPTSIHERIASLPLRTGANGSVGIFL